MLQELHALHDQNHIQVVVIIMKHPLNCCKVHMCLAYSHWCPSEALQMGVCSSDLYTLLLFVMCRLGFQQQPFVLDWQQALPASLHSRVRSVLITAAGQGCLNLQAKLQVCTWLACIFCQCRLNTVFCTGLNTTDGVGVNMAYMEVMHVLYMLLCTLQCSSLVFPV